MKAILVLAAALLLGGCSAKSGAVLWNPFTWMARVAPASVDNANEKKAEAETKVDAKETAVIHAANVEVAKASEVLATAPDSRPVQLARRFTGNAHSLLNQVGPLTVEESNATRELIAALLSENERVRASAEVTLTKAERENEKKAEALTKAVADLARREQALASANANLREAYDRENALANQVRNFWFIAGLLAFLWVVANLLPLLARFIPGLAPIATAANLVAAPALAYAEQRARSGLRKIGEGMKVVRDKLPDVAEKVTDIFDRAADDDHKAVIGAAAGNDP